MIEIECYTDVSYAKDVGGSVIAYKISNQPIHLEFLEGVKNTQGEIKAIELCIKKIIDNYNLPPKSYIIHIFTDCQKAIDSVYPEYVKTHKMEGHIKKSMRNNRQQIFATVDKAARKELRRIRIEDR